MPIPYHVDNDIQLHYYATNLFRRSTLQSFNFHFIIQFDKKLRYTDIMCYRPLLYIKFITHMIRKALPQQH